MATLYRCPKSGRFYANLVDVDGTRRRKSLKTTDPKVAEALLANAVQLQAHARILGVDHVKQAEPTTFKSFVDEVYLPACEANLKARTVESYRTYAEKTCEAFGDKYLSAIGTNDVARYLDQLRRGAYKRGETPIPFSVATVNRYKNFLSGVFTDALDRDLIKAHPMRGRKRFKNRKENNLRVRSLTAFEEGRLLEFSPAWFAPMVRFALATALRRGEILKLRWQDVDREHRRLWLRDTKAGEDQTVPLNRTSEAILDSLAPRVIDGKVSPLVFPDPSTGNEMDRCDVDYAMRSTVQKAGLVDLHFHDLRHTAGTRAYAATKDIKAVQKLLRHSSLTVTLRYVHEAEEDVQAAVDALEAPDFVAGDISNLSPKKIEKRHVGDMSKASKPATGVRKTSESVAHVAAV